MVEGGICGRGHVWQGHAWQGACVAEGMNGGGCEGWEVCVVAGVHGREHV